MTDNQPFDFDQGGTGVWDIDAIAGETTLGEPTEQEIKTWGEEAARFVSSKIGIREGQWRGARPLGRGSSGIVGLWEKVNGNGEVVDRVVIKEEDHAQSRGVPPEVETMKLLNDTGCDFVVKLRGYKRYGSEGRRRIYMEFCPHQDLMELILRYRLHERHLPERFLWHVFHSLLEAAYAMEKGPFFDENGQTLDFQIVHRDIKPANIFLSDEIRDVPSGDPLFPYYPTPKLGDFGIAIKTHPNDKNNPQKYYGAGSCAYKAPEQYRNSDRFWNPTFRNTNKQLLSWTNVYSIGLVMYELSTLRRFTKKHSGYPNDEGEGLEFFSTNQKHDEYTKTLRNKIRECLRPKTDMRPSIKSLLDQTRRLIKLWHTPHDLQKHTVHPFDEERIYYQANEIEEMPVGDYYDSSASDKEPLDSLDLSSLCESEGGFPTMLESADGEDPERRKESRRKKSKAELDREFFEKYVAAASEFMKAQKRREEAEEAKLRVDSDSDDSDDSHGASGEEFERKQEEK